MKTHPMLFSGPMIRALLDGRKTQTRRILKPSMNEHGRQVWPCFQNGKRNDVMCWPPRIAVGPNESRLSPVAIDVGDLIWARETWNAFSFSEDGDEAWPTKTIPTAEEMQEIREMAYRVDVQAVYQESDRARKWFSDQKWRPGIHMPRWASRITLEVTDVRVQRLQDIDRFDAISEGLKRAHQPALAQEQHCFPWTYDGSPMIGSPISAFSHLWNSINGLDAWEQNPWVVAYSFTVHQCNINQIGETNGIR